MAKKEVDSHGRSARVLWGLIALVLGVMLLVSPGMTAVFIVQAVAVFCLVGGVVDVLQALFSRQQEGRGWALLGGIVGILGGLMILGYPFLGLVITTATLYVFAAVSALVYGLTNLLGARTGKHWPWGRFFLGVLQVLIGVLMLWHPVIGSLQFTTVLAIVAVLGGIGLVGLALRRRPVAHYEGT